MKHRKLKKVFAIFLFITIVIAGFGQAVLQLWNWLMPTIFGLPRIGFWQALGLLMLSWILFGGMRGMHAGRRHWRRRPRPPYTDFGSEKMTAEEGEFYRSKLRRFCA